MFVVAGLLTYFPDASCRIEASRNFVACVPGTHGNPLIGWCTWSLFSGADVYQSNCLSFGPLPIFTLRLFVHCMVPRRGMLLLLSSWYGEIQSFFAKALNCNYFCHCSGVQHAHTHCDT